jgi:hypothetical protein
MENPMSLRKIAGYYLLGTALLACAASLYQYHCWVESGIVGGCAVVLLGGVLRSQL